MSRIGKTPIPVPSGVDVTIAGAHITVKGPKGTLERDIPGAITVRQDGEELLVERPNDERQNRALHGLVRSLVNNMVVGVHEEFTKELEIIGVGYRAAARARASSTSPSASATPSRSTPPRASASRPPPRTASS